MNVTSGSPRVLYVITKATWGGAQRYVHDLMRAASSEGMTVSLAYGEPGILSTRMADQGYSVHQIPSLCRDPSLSSDIRALTELTELFAHERPDVVHLNSSKAGFLGALAARRAGIRNVIFTAHGWAFTESRSLLSKCLFLAFHYVTVLLSSRTIAVSGSVARHTRHWPFAAHKVKTIPLGIGAEPLLSREEARTELINKDPSLAQANDQPWVGTIAELHMNKGLDIGIEAWKRAAPHAQWVVLGGGEEEQALRAQANESGAIHLLGFIPDASRYLKAFDLFLLPSRTEAFGYVLLEAGMAGLPILASRVGGIPEVVNNPTALFPVGNVSELAARLTSILSDNSERTRNAAQFHARVMSLYTREAMTAATFAEYA